MKVLIVDDSSLIRHAINKILVKYFPADSMQIDFAEDGDVALAYINEHRPSVILLDIIMERVGGIEVLKKLYDKTTNGEHQIIMITGLDDNAILKTCFQMGAKDFIRKPINEVELVARLEGAVRLDKLITDLKKVQNSVIDKNRELNHINKQLLETKNQMVQSEKLAGIGHLAAGIAHEINNPVGFISSNLSTLKHYYQTWQTFYEAQDAAIKTSPAGKALGYVMEDMPSLLEDTDIGIVRIKEIVDSLRSFARVDKADTFESFDVNRGLKDTLIVSKHRYRYISEVETNFGQLPNISAHGGKLNQVFINMIVNAADAIAEAQEKDGRSGLIKVETSFDRETDQVIVSISDNGIGMDQQRAHDIFNPFFTTKPVGSGTGLGLSVSYDIIVNEHKGLITVNSELGKGASFTMHLPVNQDDVFFDRQKEPAYEQ